MEIQLALCRTDDPFFDLSRQEVRKLFTPEGLEALSHRHEREQRRSAAGQWLLRELLARYAAEVSFPPRFSYGWQEKPSLTDRPDLHFNRSHSGNWAVCVLSPVPVGVDVQEHRSVRPSLIRKFSPQEQNWLSTFSEKQRAIEVMNLWCLKEAYCKCTGDGLRTPLSATTFTLHPLSLDRPGYQVCLPPSPETGYSLAVCIRSSEECTVHSVILTPPKGKTHESQ